MIDIQPQQTLIKLPLTVPPLRTPHFEVGKLESKVTPEPAYTIINFNNFEFEKYLMCELASINIQPCGMVGDQEAVCCPQILSHAELFITVSCVSVSGVAESTGVRPPIFISCTSLVVKILGSGAQPDHRMSRMNLVFVRPRTDVACKISRKFDLRAPAPLRASAQQDAQPSQVNQETPLVKSRENSGFLRIDWISGRRASSYLLINVYKISQRKSQGPAYPSFSSTAFVTSTNLTRVPNRTQLAGFLA